jgi:DNA-binding transcriptional regulator YiaG
MTLVRTLHDLIAALPQEEQRAIYQEAEHLMAEETSKPDYADLCLSVTCDRVRLKRLSEGFSIRALSRHLGVSVSTLTRFERGAGDINRHTQLRLEAWLYPDRSPPPCPCVRCTGTSARLEWECPRCRRVYAPSVTVSPLHHTERKIR